MTEFRRDPLTRRWVLAGIGQPSQKGAPAPESHRDYLTGPECHFCKNPDPKPDRSKSPDPVEPVRVIENPVLPLNPGQAEKRGLGALYDRQNPAGVHEVVIETPRHGVRLSQLSREQIQEVLKVYIQRFQQHRNNPLLSGILLFKNQGHAGSGGVSEHPHAQILGLPFVPEMIAKELAGCRRFYEMKTRCVFCDMIAEESRLEERIVAESGHFFAWAPFAARFPYEVWIAGREHHCDFSEVPPQMLGDLADILKSVLGRVEKAVPETTLSLTLHSAPFRRDTIQDYYELFYYYHWHFEVFPHLRPGSGAEWGSDFFLCPVLPETYAGALRSQ